MEELLQEFLSGFMNMLILLLRILSMGIMYENRASSSDRSIRVFGCISEFFSSRYVKLYVYFIID